MQRAYITRIFTSIRTYTYIHTYVRDLSEIEYLERKLRARLL